MIDREIFFNEVRGDLFDGNLNDDQVQGLDTILDEWHLLELPDSRWLAYILATVHHETGRKFRPIEENLNYVSGSRIKAVWPTRFAAVNEASEYVHNPEALANKVYGRRLGNTAIGDGWHYRGRGYVQITGRANYKKLGDLVNADLVQNPDRALEPLLATSILFQGMIEGLFTGQNLARYIKSGRPADWKHARRIVNGLDQAPKIADYARAYYHAINQAEINPVISHPPQPDDPGPIPVTQKPKFGKKDRLFVTALAVTIFLIFIVILIGG